MQIAIFRLIKINSLRIIKWNIENAGRFSSLEVNQSSSKGQEFIYLTCSSSMHLLLHFQNTHRQVSFQNPKKVPIKNEKRLPCQQIISRLKTTSRVYWHLLSDLKKKSNQASTNLEGRLHSSSKQHFYSTKTKTWQPKVAAPASSVLSSSCCRCRARPYSQWSASTNFQREIPSNSQRLNSFANILGKCLKLIFSIVVLNTIHFYWCQMGSLEFCLSKP